MLPIICSITHTEKINQACYVVLIASVTLLVEMKETGTLFIGSRNNYCK
jgi:hypothetical protein